MIIADLFEMDRGHWTASMWQAWVVSVNTKKEMRMRLDQVPPEFRTRVQSHVRTVLAIKNHVKKPRESDG